MPDHRSAANLRFSSNNLQSPAVKARINLNRISGTDQPPKEAVNELRLRQGEDEDQEIGRMSQKSARIMYSREPLVDAREEEHFEIGADI